ncbi:MAG: hypothetical protein ACRD0B_00185 [Acidimicrobiales bacterium]
MTPTYDAPTLRVVRQLAAAFDLDGPTLAGSPVLPRLLPGVLRHMPAEQLLDRLRALGPTLAGTRDPYAAVVSRCRLVAAGVEQRAEWAAGDAADAETRQAEAEARHRKLLGRLVEAGELTEGEAVDELTARGYGSAPIAEVIAEVPG